mmetsp:Transcript_87308/g.260476  ORF Transcript_87308/g.260476 Transcript_87308/m.260476 type:complete len:262 (-) Transcript_87308:26-811(-)
MMRQSQLRAAGQHAPSARRVCRALGLATLAVAASRLASEAFLQFGARPEAGASREEAAARAGSAVDRRTLLAAAIGGLGLGTSGSSMAYMEKLRVAYPPIDKSDKNRCGWRSSAMGQANAARDKLFDLRECKMQGTSAADKDIAGVLMNGGDFTNVDFTNTIMSKAIATNATFDGANFRNAVADRVEFTGSSCKGTIFKNAVLTGSDFTDADLTDADFTDAYIEMYAIKPLCRNPTMKGTNPVTGADTYESAGCFNQGLAR